jgi:hypothetical protein
MLSGSPPFVRASEVALISAPLRPGASDFNAAPRLTGTFRRRARPRARKGPGRAVPDDRCVRKGGAHSGGPNGSGACCVDCARHPEPNGARIAARYQPTRGIVLGSSLLRPAASSRRAIPIAASLVLALALVGTGAIALTLALGLASSPSSTPAGGNVVAGVTTNTAAAAVSDQPSPGRLCGANARRDDRGRYWTDIGAYYGCSDYEVEFNSEMTHVAW